MPEPGGGESQSRLPQLRNPNQEAGSGEGNLPVAAFFGKLSETPSGEDPAYWPINVLNKINAAIVDRDHASDDPLKNPWGLNTRELGERFAPMQEHMQKVKTAYEILAYPHCKNELSRENIEDELRRDRESNERDQVELSDAEFQILTKLAVARKLPFNPEKRVYKYDEVFHPSQPIEPALDAAQFIKWQHEQERAKQQGNKH
jgi:hypothetical protein